MSEHINLDSMSKEDLINLKEEIDHRLKGTASFWDTIDALTAIKNEELRLRQKYRKIAHSCGSIKKLEELGFTLVLYSKEDEKRVGFINYGISKVNDCFYGFEVSGEGISVCNMLQALSEKDMATVIEIFKQEELRS